MTAPQWLVEVLAEALEPWTPSPAFETDNETRVRLADFRLHAAQDVAQVIAAALVERLDNAAKAQERVPEVDKKSVHPEWAHRVCQLKGCNLHVWGLGTATPDEGRYCSYHDGFFDALAAVKTALGIGD